MAKPVKTIAVAIEYADETVRLFELHNPLKTVFRYGYSVLGEHPNNFTVQLGIDLADEGSFTVHCDDVLEPTEEEKSNVSAGAAHV
jgi:hypothetical protein